MHARSDGQIPDFPGWTSQFWCLIFIVEADTQPNVQSAKSHQLAGGQIAMLDGQTRV